MAQSTLRNFQTSGTECPTCGKDGFSTVGDMKKHHTHAHNESIAGVEVVCEACGDKFRRCKDHLSDQTHSFCSEECHGSFRSDYYTGERNPYHSESEELLCDNCGEWYEIIPSEAEGSRFCSYTCHGEWMSDNLTGQDHPCWRGGKNILDSVKAQLPVNWKRRRVEAKDRDGNECQMCGTGESLESHHIIPIMCGGTHGFWNLLTLCASCHNKAESYTRQYSEFDPVLVE